MRFQLALLATIVAGLISGCGPDAKTLEKQGSDAHRLHDYQLALTKFEAAAKRGDADAQWELGRMYGLGEGTAVDWAKAEKWFRKSAEQSNSHGENLLGLMYKTGIDGAVPKDDVQAVAWFQKAAEKGNAGAQDSLAWYYYHGAGGLKEDPALAFSWYRKAAEHGDADAQVQLSKGYYQGLGGLSKDPSLGTAWLLKAAQQGNAEAQFELGARYSSGTGVQKDWKQAVEWTKRAAEQGHADAEALLSAAYSGGQGGLPEDPKQAVFWAQKGAEHGSAEAQLLLGDAYSKGGGGLPRDDAQASHWWGLAAKQGHEVAAQHLAALSNRPDRASALQQIERSLTYADSTVSNAEYVNGYAEGQRYVVIAKWKRTMKKSWAQMNKDSDAAFEANKTGAGAVGLIAGMFGGMVARSRYGNYQAGDVFQETGAFQFIRTEKGWMFGGAK